ncbi:MAG: imidazole glycerol phosphate synthase subunit HisH [Flammeovirgaceae bacterium TMED32]|nr:MAG: imidazole glycerol phosphate synthase subunit HisH [Flammeovirgaceae bacterium TMED32]
MKVVIIKYNAGNVQSLEFALNRLGIDPLVTDDHEEIQHADKIIFPGQGEARSAMNYLKDKKLDRVLTQLRQPVLGICLGMQLMCSHTEENDTTCLGIMDVKVKRFEGSFKIPHMGWNNITQLSGVLFAEIKEQDYLYFVHSYYVNICEQTIAQAKYGNNFSIALQKNNFYAIQPHPEKSADCGIQILDNFLKI